MKTTITNSKIDFWEQNFRIKNLTNSFEKAKAFQLRHKVFVDELKWVTQQMDGLEIDIYDDEGMVPLGVFDQTGNLIAHLRVTLPQRTFMMEKEFAELIETPICKTSTTVEISRVCTLPSSRKTRLITSYGSYSISMLLYKGLYLWCQQNLFNDMCMVIESKLFKLLRMSGFPCKKIGKSTIMPDGVSTVAVRVDWREFELINRHTKPHLLKWFENANMMQEAA